MDKDWLINQIQEEAERAFESKWEEQIDDDNARLAFKKVQNTSAWKQFKEDMIEVYKKQIKKNILDKLQGLDELIREAGEV